MREGDPNAGGTSRQPIMTAYRQRAIACAAAMREIGARPRDLRHLAEDAGSILSRNVYGWFERVRSGHYCLSDQGRAMVAGVEDARAEKTWPSRTCRAFAACNL